MRKIRLWLMVLILFIVMAPTCQAEDTTDETWAMLESQMDLLNWEVIQEVEQDLTAAAPYTQNFDLKEEVTKMVTGETRFSLEQLGGLLLDMFIAESGTYIQLLTRFLLIVIMCSLLETLTSSFKSKQTTTIAFIVCYMMIILVVSESLWVVVDLARTTVQHMSQMMMAALPTLLAFMAISGYITSSSALATVIISAMNSVTFIVSNLVIPMVTALIVLQIVGTMSDEIKVDKIVDLFYKCVRWGLRGVFVASMAIMTIYKMTLPYIDMTLKKTAVSVTSAFVPIVGDASKSAFEFILACGQLIKSSFAIGIVLWVIVVASMPLIKLVLYVLMYNIVGAVVQPIANKKMVKITGILAKGCEFVLSCTTTVVVLAIMVMLVCASIGTSIT